MYEIFNCFQVFFYTLSFTTFVSDYIVLIRTYRYLLLYPNIYGITLDCHAHPFGNMLWNFEVEYTWLTNGNLMRRRLWYIVALVNNHVDAEMETSGNIYVSQIKLVADIYRVWDSLEFKGSKKLNFTFLRSWKLI